MSKIDPTLQRELQQHQQEQILKQMISELTSECWDKCLNDKSKQSSSMDSYSTNCLQNCVERFVDTTKFLTDRLTNISSMMNNDDTSSFSTGSTGYDFASDESSKQKDTTKSKWCCPIWSNMNCPIKIVSSIIRVTEERIKPDFFDLFDKHFILPYLSIRCGEDGKLRKCLQKSNLHLVIHQPNELIPDTTTTTTTTTIIESQINESSTDEKIKRRKVFVNRMFIDEKIDEKIYQELLKKYLTKDIFVEKIEKKTMTFLHDKFLLHFHNINMTDIFNSYADHIQSEFDNDDDDDDETIKRIRLSKESDINRGGFSQIGNIIQLNLRESWKTYRHTIAVCLLKKIVTSSIVVNKLGSLSNQFRNLQFEVLAVKNGEGEIFANIHEEENESFLNKYQMDTNVCCKENKFSYYFDFSKVFWNSRLSTEHDRTISKVIQSISNDQEKNHIIFDLFAGIGPFVIPITYQLLEESIQRQTNGKFPFKIFANDLNPDCYKSLLINFEKNIKLSRSKMKKNKINFDFKELYECYNKDAGEVIRTDMKRFLEENPENNSIYVIMNLPELAPTFLPLLSEIIGKFGEKNSFQIFCYCFDLEEYRAAVREQQTTRKNRFQNAPTEIGKKFLENFELYKNFKKRIEVNEVRHVATNKNMYCAIIHLIPTMGREEREEKLEIENNSKG
ncbi:hypothetical protein SNEBB_005686 [Seison nebaliae]|nr:hypothetical protein SNEBB_005686 [Seison nebaliae]